MGDSRKKVRRQDLNIELVEGIVPKVHLENYFEDFLNDIHEQADFDGRTCPRGTLLRYFDEMTFSYELLIHVEAKLQSGDWLKVDGNYYWKSDLDKVFKFV